MKGCEAFSANVVLAACKCNAHAIWRGLQDNGCLFVTALCAVRLNMRLGQLCGASDFVILDLATKQAMLDFKASFVCSANLSSRKQTGAFTGVFWHLL